MKVSIGNLGPVISAELELKPLTVFVGANGTGKTWSAYAISCATSKSVPFRFLQDYIERPIPFQLPFLGEIVNTLLGQGFVDLSVNDLLRNHSSSYFNLVSGEVPCLLRKLLSSTKSSIPNFTFNMDLQNDLPGAIDRAINMSFLESSSIPVFIVQKKSNSDLLGLRVTPSENPLQKNVASFWVTSVLLSFIHESFFPDSWLLPTERSLLSGNEVQRVPRRQQDPLGDNTEYPPVLDSINRILSDACRKEEIGIIPKKNPLRTLGEVLERKILDGRLSLEKQNKDAFRMFFSGKDYKVEVSAASSMIKELSLLSTYLKGSASVGDIVVIDEPEMNLHPLAQAQTAELLAMLANMGLKVICTTHSPYLVSHLDNLIDAGIRPENATKAAKFFLLKSERAILSSTDVAVYLFGKGTARPLLKKDRGIDWRTFSDVSSKLMGISRSIREL